MRQHVRKQRVVRLPVEGDLHAAVAIRLAEPCAARRVELRYHRVKAVVVALVVEHVDQPAPTEDVGSPRHVEGVAEPVVELVEHAGPAPRFTRGHVGHKQEVLRALVDLEVQPQRVAGLLGFDEQRFGARLHHLVRQRAPERRLRLAFGDRSAARPCRCRGALPRPLPGLLGHGVGDVRFRLGNGGLADRLAAAGQRRPLGQRRVGAQGAGQRVLARPVRVARIEHGPKLQPRLAVVALQQPFVDRVDPRRFQHRPGHAADLVLAADLKHKAQRVEAHHGAPQRRAAVAHRHPQGRVDRARRRGRCEQRRVHPARVGKRGGRRVGHGPQAGRPSGYTQQQKGHRTALLPAPTHLINVTHVGHQSFMGAGRPHHRNSPSLAP